MTKSYDVTNQSHRKSQKTETQQNVYFAVCGIKILCKISKVPFEILHKILNP